MRRALLLATIVAFVVLPIAAARADCKPVPQVPNCPTANPSPTPTSNPTPAPTSGSANAQADTVALERQFFNLVNQERARRGMKALSYDSTLTGVARRHSAQMASEGRLYHNTDELRSEEFARRNGYPLMVGENVGEGPSVRWLHDAFMESPTHRDNIIERRYTNLGIGVTVQDNTIWVTQDYTQARAGSRPASFPRVPIGPRSVNPPRTANAPAAPAAPIAAGTLRAIVPAAAPRLPQVSALRVPPIPAPIPASDDTPRKPLLPLAALATLSAVAFASRRDAGAWI